MDVFLAIVSMAIGAIVTWLVSRWYYVKAGRDLATEAQALRQKTDLVIYCLTNPGANIEAIRDADGNVTGLKVSATATASGAARFSASGTLHDASKPSE